MKVKKDKLWEDYPMGTKAFATCGGYWIKIKAGWQWYTFGGIVPEPRYWLFSGWVEEPVIKLRKDKRKRKKKT